MRKLVIILITLIVLSIASSSPLVIAEGKVPKIADKVVLISIDAARPDFILKYIREGKMPGMSEIIHKGVWAEYMITSFPSATAVAHATISTGAPPSITGITGNKIHLPGLPVYKAVTGFSAEYLLAEPIWMTVDKHGLKAIVASFPQSTPAYWKDKVKNSVLFNPYDAWLGAYSNSELYTTNTSIKGYPEYITLTEATNWKNLNVLGKVAKALEAQITVGEDKWWILVYDSDGDGIQDKVAIVPGPEKDAAKAAAVLSEDEWSKPINAVIHVKGVAYTVAPRFKVLRITPLDDFRLYRTIIRPLEAMWCTDEELKKKVWENVVLKVGMVTDGDWWGLVNKWYGPETYMETVKLANDFFKELTIYLLENTEWNLFLTYTPIVDNVQHQFLGLIYPNMPYYDPGMAEIYAKYIEQAYSWADEIVFEVLKRVDLRNTVVIVVSDHGQWPVKKTVYINSALAEAGLIAYDEKGNILWNETKAYFVGYCQIWVNLKDREEGGVVDREEYGKVVNEVIKVLSSLRDPDTGEPVIGFIATNEQAKALGLTGSRVGDVVFSMKPGYVASTKLMMKNGEPVIFGDITPLKTITGTHGDLPYYPDLHAMFGIIGKGIVAGKTIPPVRTIDIAPTISVILGISKPANSTGLPILEALEKLPSITEIITTTTTTTETVTTTTSLTIIYTTTEISTKTETFTTTAVKTTTMTTTSPITITTTKTETTTTPSPTTITTTVPVTEWTTVITVAVILLIIGLIAGFIAGRKTAYARPRFA